jgi:hypothetical protein
MATKAAVKNISNGAVVAAAEEHLASIQSQTLSEVEMMQLVEEWMQGQVDRALAQANAEMAEPFPWWDVYAVGPFQALGTFPGPLAPHQVIKLGQSATIFTVVYLNPITNVIAAPPTTARDFLTSFGTIPYSVTVSTGNKSLWQLAPGAGLNASQSGLLAPFGQTFFVNAFSFTPTTAGLHEMSISARIGNPGSAAPFGGQATWVVDPDTDILLPGLGVATRPAGLRQIPVTFQVYQ